MIAVDTNILVYAHREDSPWHEAAKARVVELAEGPSSWAIPWPCLHEFLAIITHPRIFKTPTPATVAVDGGRRAAGSPAPRPPLRDGRVLGRAAEARGEAGSSRARSSTTPGSRPCAAFHGVSELWSADRDFSRFPELAVRNPLLG